MLASVAVAQQSNPYTGDAQAAETGRGMFRIYCAPCHGMRAQGGRGPDLSRGTFTAGDSDADLFKVIRNGVPGTDMNAYNEFSEDVIWRVITYIRSTTRADAAPVSGNAANGSQLFWGKGGCGACHTIGAKGGRLGPDLTKIGRQRSAAYLRESVVEPNKDLTPGYATITVITRDGKKIVGVQKGFDNFSAQLMDASENFHSFQKDKVQSMKREFRSLMPDNYSRLFSGAELNDLVAYMCSLRGEVTRP